MDFPQLHARHQQCKLVVWLQVDTQVKGEDWEHEDERADDDVDMGEEGEDADANPTPPKSAIHLVSVLFTKTVVGSF